MGIGIFGNLGGKSLIGSALELLSVRTPNLPVIRTNDKNANCILQALIGTRSNINLINLKVAKIDASRADAVIIRFAYSIFIRHSLSGIANFGVVTFLGAIGRRGAICSHELRGRSCGATPLDDVSARQT